MGGEVTDAWTLVQKIADMGEPLYSKLEPNGYPERRRDVAEHGGTHGAHEFRGARSLPVRCRA